MNFYLNLSLENLSTERDGILYIEQWKPIFNYEGKYEVSSFGRIKSFRRPVPFIMKQYNSSGYLKVDLYDYWVRSKAFVHILVGRSFIGNEYNKLEINHKKGNRNNNFYLDLEWSTSSENTNHAYYELHCKKRGKNKSTVNGVLQLSVDGNLVKEWNSFSEIKKELGFDWSTLSRCCRGQLITSYGFKWKYKEAI